mgnify:CR=1
QGEFRSGMRAIARKEDRLQRIEEKRQRMEEFIAQKAESDAVGDANLSNLQLIDSELLDLAEKQRKRSKRA